MIKGGRGGAIVNVTSIEGSRAAPNFSVYAACKAGMINFTRTMALELGEHGIRVNCIAPDITDTPGTIGENGEKLTPNNVEGRSRYIPLRRRGHIEECGSAAVFLCSKMASYITGATIPVDGGTWASSGWSRTPKGEWDHTHTLDDYRVEN
jgi:NAD(P)-dependent dehydrogenase (short-subunit alcohol dehydrogenase family)